MKVTHNDIKENAYDNAYSKGLGYYHSSKVLSCTLDENDLFSLTLSGIVKGSGYHKYRQLIEISDEDGEVYIEGQC
ncbi:MAG: hypothetical protein U9R50_07145, partial [Campylobacterota bacterium]|nr:hypothetical protein [Campylobacterota bacterium]